MYDQFSLQVSLMELEREVRAWRMEAETLRALGDRPSRLADLRHWFAGAGARIRRMAGARKPHPAKTSDHQELGSSATA